MPRCIARLEPHCSLYSSPGSPYPRRHLVLSMKLLQVFRRKAQSGHTNQRMLENVELKNAELGRRMTWT